MFCCVTNMDHPTVNLHPPSIFQGNFYNTLYSIQPTSTDDVLMVSYSEILKCVSDNKKTPTTTNTKVYKTPVADFYMCLTHGVNVKSMCVNCHRFEQFPYTFGVVGRFDDKYLFLSPRLYIAKNVQYFFSFLSKIEAWQSIEQLHQLQNVYKSFKMANFKLGSVSNLMSGKKSFIRTAILGNKVNGARLTLTVDASLPPNLVAVPRSMYDKMNLSSNYIILNRDPSINGKCIYVCELCAYDTEDCSIHINCFILDGLHADQDGDELNLYIIFGNAEVPTFDVSSAILEMKRLSWTNGCRHDLLYNPRYSLGQYYAHLVFEYNDWFNRHSPLWASIRAPVHNKGKVLMALGCSYMRREVDDFLNMMIQFGQKLKPGVVPVNDLITGEGIIKNVVQSGAKGSVVHIQKYVQKLFNQTELEEKQLSDGFNHKITSSLNMEKEGRRQFNLLYLLNSMVYFQDSLYINNKKIAENIDHSIPMAGIFYNTTAVNYLFDSFMSDI